MLEEVNIKDLNPDKYYWLQVDGSAGGATGTFYIDIIPEVLDEKLFKIFPNPSSGMFKFEFKFRLNTISIVEVYNSTGILLSSKSYPIQDYNILDVNLENLDEGIYFIKVITNSSNYFNKISIIK